jgi:hypothetical protein
METTDMRHFTQTCAQGDVLFRKALTVPTRAQAVPPVGGAVVVTHSETGHDHVMVLDRDTDVPAVEMFDDPDNALISWIRVNRPTALEHRRPFDTHEPILFEPGVYEVRRQREYVPEGFRRVED